MSTEGLVARSRQRMPCRVPRTLSFAVFVTVHVATEEDGLKASKRKREIRSVRSVKAHIDVV
jgi:hypothetical protein